MKIYRGWVGWDIRYFAPTAIDLGHKMTQEGRAGGPIIPRAVISFPLPPVSPAEFDETEGGPEIVRPAARSILPSIVSVVVVCRCQMKSFPEAENECSIQRIYSAR